MSGFGVVKSVLSGDTIVVLGAPRPGSAPPELQLSLSYVTAPRISRHPEQKDEPFGWPSREFLRQSLIGKQVKFRVDYRVEKINRSFATIWASEEGPCVNETVAAAGWGRVTGPDALRGAPQADTYEGILAAGRAAEAEGRGMFDATPGAAEASVRNITWSVADGASFAAAMSGKPQPGVIEQVRDGSSYRIYLHDAMTVISFNLAGAQCPRPPATPAGAAAAAPAPAPAPVPAPAPTVSVPISAAATSGKVAWGAKIAPTSIPVAAAPSAAARPAASEPAGAAGAAATVDPTTAIALEAKTFVEIRLLNRDVTVHIGGADKYGNLLGRLEHPAGDIAVELLKNGFAKMVDWSLSSTTAAHAGVLRAAERSAKGSKLRLWANYVPVEFKGEKKYTGRVIEAVSGDTIVVLVSHGAHREERRVSLSSVRAPRAGNPRVGDGKDQPYAFESKEWLRRNLVGRDVDVTVDYMRKVPVGGAPGGDAEPATQERAFATVKLTTKKGDETNVAVQLIGDGLAEVVRHRPDEERSSAYDELLAAEEAAKAAKKNIFSGKDAPVRRVTDLSSDATKAKAHFSFLEREKTLRAVVEHVFAGGRAKLFVPSQNCTIMFGVAAVRCPAIAKPASKGPDGKMRPGRAAEPFGAEALSYMRENTMQQEVEIEATAIDANGVVLGPMWIGKGGARRSVGADLLRRGLGYGIYPVIERQRDCAELMAAEAEAKAAKRGVWESYVEPEAEEEEAAMATGAAASSAAAGAAGMLYAAVADIVDGATFYAHLEADAAKLEAVKARMSEMSAEFGTQSAMVDTKKGKIVACLFEEEPGVQSWFRARIEGKAKDDSGKPLVSSEGLELYTVTFIDYGNTDRATVHRMRPLDGPFGTLPALAKECVLAYIRVPKLSQEYGTEAARFLSDTLLGQRVGLRVHVKEPNARLAVSAWSEDGEACANEELILAGLARVSRTDAKRVQRNARMDPDDKDMQFLKRLEAAQETARKGRVGMYRYGDVGDSDDERARK